jgi:hypothetical protein
MADYFNSLYAIEEENKRLSNEILKSEIRQCQLSINLLDRILSEISDVYKTEKIETAAKSATVLLTHRFLLSSKCFCNNVQAGYYYEAKILLRSMEENLFYCWGFSQSNDCAKRWYAQKLDFKSVKKTINFDKSPEAYKELCDFTHPNLSGIVAYFGTIDEHKLSLACAPKFDASEKSLLQAFRSLNATMLQIQRTTFEDDLKLETKNVIQKFTKAEIEDIKKATQ